MTGMIVAQLEQACKRYGAVQALEQASLAVQRGEVYALLGPNGAGKTTAISLLLGLARADAGQATLFGAAPQDLAARRRIGVMLQAAALPDTLSVAEHITLVRSYYPQPRSVADIAAMAGISDLLKRRYGKLSAGQQRRVQFALAVSGRPELLFLDEPTVGMDVESRGHFWRTVRGMVHEGCAVVLTTHYLEEAEALADRVGIIVSGRLLAQGKLDEIRGRVGQRHIRCVSSLEASNVKEWKNVHSVERDGDWLTIHALEAETVLRELLAADAHVREIEVRRAGLAEAMSAITREAA